MTAPPIRLERTGLRVLPDARRVLARPFLPGEETLLPGTSRVALLMERLLAIPEERLDALNAEIERRFSQRHANLGRTFERHFGLVAEHVPEGVEISAHRRRLIGAYFTHEFSVEGAALFNPSIVRSPDQRGVENGSMRFVMSVRAVGEGHLSSIEFRSGAIDADGWVAFEPSGSVLVGGERSPPEHFDRAHFAAKLAELDALNDLSASLLGWLDDKFTIDELEAALLRLERGGTPHAIWFETVRAVRVLASSSYITTFPPDSRLEERVIFPAGPNETRGMEDARFVRFVAADGRAKYYATYTAYDGFGILPQLIETDDFVRFKVSTLHGAAAQNKGMALFPRLIGGRYAMLSRKDRENLHLAASDDVHHWDDVEELYRPQSPWELLQIGNCGSPLETEAGWLVLTHGVGPMRRYTLGALLLDLADPRRILGHLAQPLLEPDETEREGYVPNVIYTCGAIVHAGWLIVPYGFSDTGVGVARLRLHDLLDALRHGR